jgi:hypothetical protein
MSGRNRVIDPQGRQRGKESRSRFSHTVLRTHPKLIGCGTNTAALLVFASLQKNVIRQIKTTSSNLILRISLHARSQQQMNITNNTYENLTSIIRFRLRLRTFCCVASGSAQILTSLTSKNFCFSGDSAFVTSTAVANLYSSFVLSLSIAISQLSDQNASSPLSSKI